VVRRGLSGSSRAHALGSFPAPAAEEEDTPLSWRSAPEASLSDWRIVTKGADAQRAEYHAHRAILGVGPRKSDYFARLFTSAGAALAEGSGSTSTLELEQTAFDAFPAFLDFVYEGKLEVDAASAVALLHLAHYLLNRALFDKAQQFIQDALGPGDDEVLAFVAPVLLEQATLYVLEEVGEACVTVCAALFLLQVPTHWTSLEPSLFLRVLTAVEDPDPPGGRPFSDALSEHIHAYCDRHKVCHRSLQC